MDAAIDIHAATASTSLGIKHSVQVFAGIPGVGVAHLAWKDTVRVPVPPGDHVVAIWAKLARKAHQGISHARVHLDPGQSVGLRWQMPDTVFGRGSITPTAGPPLRLAYIEALPLPPDAGPCQLWPPHPVDTLGPTPLDEPQPIAATAGAPAGAWHPDPAGRWPHRWWDGARWTDAVSDGARTFSDPLPGL